MVKRVIKILFIGNIFSLKGNIEKLDHLQYCVDVHAQLPDSIFKSHFNFYDIIILDFSIFKGKSYVLCKTIKNLHPNIYLLFLFPVNITEQEILNCYQAGADDYLYLGLSSISILQKKLDKLLSRKQSFISTDTYQDHHIVLNFYSLIASIDDINITFTPLEFKLLKLFTRNPHIVLTREYILYFLWDRNKNHVEESSLNSMICRIRKKINPKYHNYIKMIYGVGYMWIPYFKDSSKEIEKYS